MYAYFGVMILQTILTHSRSRVVLRLLQEASNSGKRITVFITTSTIDGTGYVFIILLIYIFYIYIWL